MVKSFADICFDHLEMLYPCLFFSMLAMPCGCLPFQPCHALPIQKKWHFCHPSSSMVCKCKPVSPVRGLSPLRGDLPQQRSLDGRSKGGGGDLCWNHNTEPYTMKANTSTASTNCALLQVSVSLPAFKTTPPHHTHTKNWVGQNPIFRKSEMGGSP